MKLLQRTLPLALLAAVLTSPHWLTQAKNDPGGSELHKVLLIDGQNNHKWQATSPIMKQALELQTGFQVEVSTTPPKGSAPEAWDSWKPDFSQYDAVLSNYNGESWPERVQNDFDRFVRDGGALIVVHAANNSFPDWHNYNEMIGLGGWGRRNELSGPYIYYKDGKMERDLSAGRGGSHGKQWSFNVDIVAPEHPITKGMPKSWRHTKDELYSELRGPANNMTVLATSTSKSTQRDEPMIMVLDYGKGRVFHTPMGHADYSMHCQGFFTTLQRGTEWAITGEVTIPIPDNFPTADTESLIAP